MMHHYPRRQHGILSGALAFDIDALNCKPIESILEKDKATLQLNEASTQKRDLLSGVELISCRTS